MRLPLALSVLALLAACAAPAIDDTLVNDNVLPRRGDTSTTDAGTKVPGDGGTVPQTESFTLTVTLAGTATGTVASTPTGLTCSGTTCKGTFPRGTAVTLMPTPAPGAIFGGWIGSTCTGTASCAISIASDVAASAEFRLLDGTWSGTYTNSRAASGCNFNNAGNLGVTVKTTSGKIAESATVTGLELRNTGSCDLVGSTTGAAPLSDVTLSGNTLTGTWTFDVQGASGSLAFPFTAKVDGKTMTGSWTCPGCTGKFTLTTP